MFGLKQIFVKLANKFGLELQEKATFIDDYSNVNDISLTSVIANRISTITMLDSGATIEGQNKRAEFLQNFLQEFLANRMSVAAEVSLGTGDCLIKPYTDGKYIGIDIIPNNNFYICESVGNHIKSCIIKSDEYKTKNGDLFQRYETQKIEEIKTENGIISTLVIYNNAFKNGNEISLSDVPGWQNIQPVIYIYNTENLLFGRYKCPTVNRNNINSVNGVKITYGLDSIIKNATEAYKRFNTEFELKETFIFADKSIFKRTTNGNIELPKGKEKMFMNIDAGDKEGLIQEYSPIIRSNELEKGLEVNLKILELLCGLSAGILTAPTTTYATATEMKASLQATFAYITNFRKVLENGTKELLNAINILCNVNNITPIGDYEIKFDWSSSYIENIEEQFNRLMQLESINGVDVAEVRAWAMDENYQEAKAKVMEISENMPKMNEFL